MKWRSVLPAGVLLAASPSAAQTMPKLPTKPATYVWEKKLLRATFSFREIVDADVEKKLVSGIPTVIVLRAYLFEEGQENPVALSAKSCRVAFDPWDEVFRIQVSQPGGDVTVVSPTLAGVLRRCAEADKLAIVDRSRLKVDGRYLLQAIVEVNPVSKEILDRIRRWVSRPTGATTIGAGDALFGSFVGLFAAKMGTSDRELKFRTPVVVVPAPEP